MASCIAFADSQGVIDAAGTVAAPMRRSGFTGRPV